MTGTERLLFLIMYLMIGFAMIAFLFILLGPLDSAKTATKSMSLQISGLYNGMLSAPVGTAQELDLPSMECKIIFKGTAVNVSSGNVSAESPVLIPEYPVEIITLGSLVCKAGTVIRMEKMEVNKILVRVGNYRYIGSGGAGGE